MKILTDHSAIIALSTPANANSAIGVIRISGFENISEFASSLSISIDKIKPRYSHYISIIKGQTVLDEVVMVFYPGPNSYTGENLLELSCHGNQIVLNSIINHFIDANSMRYAEPGEFTYRALKNGKLSISQVEGLDLILNANSPIIAEAGQSLLRGGLHQQFLELLSLIKHLRSMVDISLDFSEDVGEEQAQSLFMDSYSSFEKFVKSLYEKTVSYNSSLLTPSIVLAGDTNAGKSTLFNYLLNEQRSIVSDIRGTTRDYVTQNITISNALFNLVDTAGIRETEDLVEQEGIRRTNQQIKDSFFKILVVHIDDFVQKNIEEFDLVVITHMAETAIKTVFDADPRFLYIDLLGGPMGPLFFGPIGPEKNLINGPMGPDLKQTIFSRISTKYAEQFCDDPILIDRQKRVIEELFNYLTENRDELVTCNDFGVISFHIMHISNLVENLVGIITPDEVLTSIFSNFCIGK